eukprot:m51a1_g9939 hypothetical protein (174) ;mRNA; r:5728-8233
MSTKRTASAQGPIIEDVTEDDASRPSASRSARPVVEEPDDARTAPRPSSRSGRPQESARARAGGAAPRSAYNAGFAGDIFGGDIFGDPFFGEDPFFGGGAGSLMRSMLGPGSMLGMLGGMGMLDMGMQMPRMPQGGTSYMYSSSTVSEVGPDGRQRMRQVTNTRHSGPNGGKA